MDEAEAVTADAENFADVAVAMVATLVVVEEEEDLMAVSGDEVVVGFEVIEVAAVGIEVIEAEASVADEAVQRHLGCLGECW